MADLLRMEQIGKTFPGVKALEQVDFDLRPGEIHALVGENGAGKSTLMKVLAGIYAPDGGRIQLRGETVTINDPRRAQEFGISIVHQEPLLFTNLTIAENILAGQEPTRARPLHLLDRAQLFEKARQYLAYFDSPLSPRTPVYQLSVAQQQIVEICKALALQAGILILDEPTSSLSEGEAEQLFAIVDQLRAQGIAIVYISHRLKEVIRLADRVTVLRDGRRVGTLEGDAIETTRIINMMVGRDLHDLYGEREQAGDGEPILDVHGLSGARFSNVSLSVRRGEIVGLTGLIGSGRSEIGLTLFGYLPIRHGQMRLGGEDYRPASTEDAMHSGVAFVPEDRRKYGLFTSMSVCRNLTVTRLKDLQKRGLLTKRAEHSMAAGVADRLRIRTPHLEQRVLNLSGGNQQKTMLGKWLARAPRLLIVDEPTRGVDVGAKVEIYATLRQLAAEGIGILMISSEMPEVNGMCDRVYVMHEGALQGELSHDQINEQNIMTLASGHVLAG
ncbi:MAG: sugar ABC transporter ATP-binding protein [Anaerolineae bacterium]|nr:sugar ABC transporter ATP-binding protein [Anaerolineae bacterium]